MPITWVMSSKLYFDFNIPQDFSSRHYYVAHRVCF